MAMSRFRQGKIYTFTRGEIRAEKFQAARVRRLAFLREEAGTGVTHHLFSLVPGGSIESFTEYQLDDYKIERAA